MSNALKDLEKAGQAPWLDYVHRKMFKANEIATMVARDGLKGMTSNPSIFQKAIGESEDYNEDLKAFLANGDQSVSAIYEHLVIKDIQAAADALAPVYRATKGVDGYISLEVSPYLANDTEGTVKEALRLWKTVDRRNLMVKVPATKAGIPAIRTLIGQGLNVNVTLLFAVDAYNAVHEAYIGGLEDLAKAGGDVSKTASVASFFISRIDALIDKKLEHKKIDAARAQALRGRVAIANAKIAYESFKKTTNGDRWQALAKKGAHVQRLLWASTGVKNKDFRDTLYVETLIGPDTVNTMPPATMDAFRDHGVMNANTVQEQLPQAQETMRALHETGVSMQEVTDELVEDGVKLFADAFDQLLGTVAKRRMQALEGDAPRQTITLGDADLQKQFDAAMEEWRVKGNIRRLWAGDASLWTGADEAKWLGWLTIAQEQAQNLPKLQALALQAHEKAVVDVVLLGMGGSSLGPDVLAQTFGRRPGFPHFHMLDSTDPAQVKAVADRVRDYQNTLVIVSSKSGSTLEPNIYASYFAKRMKDARGSMQQFIAVTDPGSNLEKDAKAQGYGHIFHGLASIGGRYSVLSNFGLVPAAAIGVDLGKFMKSTMRMVHACKDDVPPAENPGVQLGLAMGLAGKAGRDKITVIASQPIQSLGAWLEQLIAESTGKQGHGLIPVDGEPLGRTEDYGKDRFFAYLEMPEHVDEEQSRLVTRLEAAGHPVVRITVPKDYAVGQEFFRWEIATAVAGSVLGINPFDQPDVEASKLKTRALTEEYEHAGKLPVETPILKEDGFSVFADAKNADALRDKSSLENLLKDFAAQIKTNDYVAFLAYIEHTAEHTEILEKMRATVMKRKKVATCLGFGPRFLHSTGQAYKGGPNSGVFFQITCDDKNDLQVPGKAYTFGVVKAAQARGDLGVLQERGRRAIRIHLHDLDIGLKRLAFLIDKVVR